MEIESFMDDLLNFSVPEENDDEDEEDELEEEEVRPQLHGKKMTRRKKVRRSADPFGLIDPDDPGLIEEEDLEWISNKDAFPVIETFVGVLPAENLRLPSPERLPAVAKQLSPVSVLETGSQSSTTTMTMTTTTTTNSSGGSNGIMAAATTTTSTMSCFGGLTVPIKARSKRRRNGRRDFSALRIHHEQAPSRKKSPATTAIGRRCQHCGAEKTPQWRAGPAGPKTLCNACGVRYKSGRLVPEYRPASSPTFSAKLHSNSHRKIVEMRRQRQVGSTSFPASGKVVDKG